MRILSYFGILIVLTQLSLIDAIKKEYQGIIMQDSDGMKLIVEDSHSKKNKLQNTLSQEDSSSKREFFDQSSIFDYFSQNNLKKQDEAQASEESKEESEEEVPEESEEEKEDEEDTEKEESEASEDGEQQSEEEKDSSQKKDSSKKDDSKEQKNEQPETEEQPKQKQTIIPLKGSENSIIITGDGETYFMRYDPITQTSQMMNMNTIKDVDFKKNTFTIDTSSSNKQKLEKYTIPTYEPFEWYQVLSEGELPQKRGGHTIIAVGQNVILFGGCQQDIQCFNDLYFYDIMELSWSTSKIFGEPPSPRSGHSATLVGSYLYIFGGSNEHGILSDLHRLNLPNRVWEQFEFEGPKPPGRTNHKAVLDNQGRIVFFGGFTVQGYSNDVYFLDLVNMRWSKPLINGDPPRPRENFSMNLVRDSYIWVFGGYALGGETNDLWQLDVDGMRWTRMLQSFGVKPIERQGHQMLLHGKLLYTLGGCNYKEQRCFNDVYQLNIDDLTWTKMEFVLENSLKERDNYGMALMGSNMYIFGGCEMMQKCYNDFLVMNITDICPKNCTGRGTCRNNRCQCQDGFFGEQCEIEMKCEYNCSNRGICGTDGNCKCYRGFTGRICEIYVPCPSNCTSIDNGLCEPNGTCLCNEGYKGLACEVGRKGLLDITIKCPNKCSNHGECNEETGICICEDGYGDLDCSLTIEEWEKEQKEKKEKAEKEKKLKEEKEKKEKEAKDNKGKSGEEASVQEADSTTTQEGEAKPDTEEGGEKIEGESSQQEEQAGETAGDESTTATEENQTETTEQTEADQPDTEQSESTTEQPTEEQVSEGSDTSESTTTTAASSDGTENAEVEQLSESELSKSEEIAKLIHMSIKQNQQQEQKDSLADCENNCSFNGVCVSEECYCKPGFTGPDCSAFKISHLQKGIKAVKLFFYVPIFLLIGIIIGYFYLKQAQEAQEEQEFGEIEDYHEDAKQRNTQDLNTHLNSGLNKNQYVEDQNDYDSVSSIKIDDSNVDGSSGTDQEHSVKDDLQQSNIFLRKPDKENVENPQGSQQIIPLQDRDSNNLDD